MILSIFQSCKKKKENLGEVNSAILALANFKVSVWKLLSK
tara:strand:- start:1054 stop:1173 length:120 start_codon:yes stop_codon:yes gene_type:complete